jgi:hypothetical protein
MTPVTAAEIREDALSFARACARTDDFEFEGRTLAAHCLKSLVVAVYMVAEQLAALRERQNDAG